MLFELNREAEDKDEVVDFATTANVAVGFGTSIDIDDDQRRCRTS